MRASVKVPPPSHLIHLHTIIREIISSLDISLGEKSLPHPNDIGSFFQFSLPCTDLERVKFRVNKQVFRWFITYKQIVISIIIKIINQNFEFAVKVWYMNFIYVFSGNRSNTNRRKINITRMTDQCRERDEIPFHLTKQDFHTWTDRSKIQHMHWESVLKLLVFTLFRTIQLVVARIGTSNHLFSHSVQIWITS